MTVAETPRYLPGFLAPAEAQALFQELLDGVPWQREWLHLYGRRVAVPRLLGWYGEPGLNYRYAGADHCCDGWRPSLLRLERRLRGELGLASNLVLLNRYRDGSDYMGWHRDDEAGLAPQIVSVSLGATRRFLVRPEVRPQVRPPSGQRAGQAPEAGRSRAFDLESGSVLIMDGLWRHSLPRTRKRLGERINLTFRRVAGPAP